ncbi:MAG: glycosyltransferase family 4 protein [Pseudomonadales bacterium]
MSVTAGRSQRSVAYVMSRFPKLTETFVLDEILEMERQGVRVEVFPLWREKEAVVHPAVRQLAQRANFLPALDLEILRDTGYWLLHQPKRLLGALADVIRDNRRSLRYLAGALAAFPKACTMARRMQAQGVCHVHAHFASHPAAIALVIGRVTGLPFSFTAHGSDLHREQAMLERKVAEAKFVVAISDYNRRFILEHAGADKADKVVVVHCGVDPNVFPRADVSCGGLRIVCTGTLHAVKGQRFLLEACQRLSQAGTDWSCHLIGDGPDRPELERLARDLGIADLVHFHGSRTQEQVRALLGTMNVGCAPSVPTADGRREGIPVALIESGACGLPLVASRLSGIPELVVDGECGLLVPPGDVASLADALLRLADDRELRQSLGQQARARVSRQFSLTAAVNSLRRQMFGGVVACS